MPAVSRTRLVVACLAMLALVSACAGTGRVVASDGSHRLIARDAATGITMVLTTETWPGDAAYGEDLTIVHVLVANMGPQPVLLAPGDFELRDDRGFDYVLYDAGGAFQAVASGPELDAFSGGPIAYDPGRSRDYETIRTEDGQLGRLALPWGVLLPGTQMRGFVYFDDLRGSANHATLRWYVQTPQHQPLAQFGFRLHVAR